MSAVKPGSPLKRKQWVKSKLLDKMAVSFWSAYSGSDQANDGNAIVMNASTATAGAGHTITFDLKGKLTGSAYEGLEYDDGMGENKRLFSSQINCKVFNFYVNNDTKFESKEVDHLELPEHSDSMMQLGDLFARQQDQSNFDLCQGAAGEYRPSHIIDLDTDFSFSSFLEIEEMIKTGDGMVKSTAEGAIATGAGSSAVRRAPLDGFTTANGEPVYLFIVDTWTATKLKNDPTFKNTMMHADVRGNNNRLIKGVIGKIGNTVYVEAPVFFGHTKGSGSFDIYTDTKLQFSGLRRYIYNKTDGKVYWEGQKNFAEALKLLKGGAANYDLMSRNLVLGNGAIQKGWGKAADYTLEWGAFKKTSKSNLEFWGNSQKTRLTVEKGSDYAGAVTDIDFSVICVDRKLA